MTDERPGSPPSWTSLIPGVYVPALVFEIGIGAMMPVLAVSAGPRGAALATAAGITARLPIGRILADLPAGAIAARLGDRFAMIVASGVAVIGMGLLAAATNLAVLGLGALLLGATEAVYSLARQSYLTEAVPVLMRARALSTLGGVHRIGLFIGPFAGAGIVHLTGSTPSIYLLGVATSVLAAVVVAVATDPDPRRTDRDRPTGLFAVMREHRRTLSTLGVAVLLVGAMRGARMTVVPLWAEHLELGAATTSLIFGIAGGIDMLLFYPAGKVMDLKGRRWVAIPSMLIMGVAMVLIPLTSTAGGLTAAALLLGFGNGIGSGVIMTLGADTAPPGERAQFLGAWRLLADLGNAGGPLIVSAGAAIGSIALGIGAMGPIAGATAAALGRWVPGRPPPQART
ncbi:MFS transporter [Pseudactinotalea sp.]|uniref:MFS transporter n=1 Tax=Pseudactinotalea sp. TaxID=1926260 RepID=UPI003B3B586B